MKKYKKIMALAIALPVIGSMISCQDMFNPAIENHKNESDLLELPAWATGLLGHAYISNPLGSWRFDDVATDDAISNDPDDKFRKMATGSWFANKNPQDNWQYLRASWQYINQFLEIVDKVKWAEDPIAAELFKQRFKGDAYGMRALYMYHLLMHHAGYSEDGTLLGIPILTESENLQSDFNLPRNTFQECLAQLNNDVAKAVELLPDEYGDIDSNDMVPAKYKSQGASATQYSRVFGNIGKNRMSARIAQAIRAQAALLAASPAYNAGSGVTWEKAANEMANVLSFLGLNPISQLDPTGNEWYKDATAIKDAPAGLNIKEMLWRSNRAEDNDIEKNQYPPTLFGKGRINPTQNLVDAFPMSNGLPITDPRSGYDPNKPYDNRDSRLKKYILVNGEKAGPQNKVINTSLDQKTNDGLLQTSTSTATGYYMKKLLCQSANADPNSNNNVYHYKPFIRYTEIFLGYAEAANEAWGPKGKGAHGYSAYDVIKAIRERAGICKNVADPYLDEASADKAEMRTLIHNERRLELCFEGFRFYDLRRWKENLNVTARGVKIEDGKYNYVDVEGRKYSDYMYYGPIPYGEVVKFSNLVQNKGW